MDSDFDVVTLKSMKRDQLQKLCKKLKLRANSKNVELVASLQQYYENLQSKKTHGDDLEDDKLLKTSKAENCQPDLDLPKQPSVVDVISPISESRCGQNLVPPGKVKRGRNSGSALRTEETQKANVTLQGERAKATTSLVITPKRNQTPKSPTPCNKLKDLRLNNKKASQEVSVIQTKSEERTLKWALPSDAICPTSCHPVKESTDLDSTRRKTYSVSPQLKSDDKLKADLVSELEQRIQKKFGTNSVTDVTHSRIPRLAVICTSKSPPPVANRKSDKFNRHHRKAFNRMESIGDYIVRKEEFKKKLMTPQATGIPTHVNQKSSNCNRKLMTTFSFSVCDKLASQATATPYKSPCNISLAVKQTSNKPQFDLKASLARPLSYKPHTGKLKDCYSENKGNSNPKTRGKRCDIKAYQVSDRRLKYRNEQQQRQKTKRGAAILNRRNLDA